MEIQKLPAPPEGIRRVESGVVQFGDDWPGFFFRGDACPFAEMSADSLCALVEAYCRITGAGFSVKHTFFNGAQSLGYMIARSHVGNDRTDEERKRKVDELTDYFEKTLREECDERV